MYCPNCAAPYSHGLKFCKQCGTQLSDSTSLQQSEPPARAPRGMGAAWALALATVAIVLGGLGIVCGTAYNMMEPIFPGQTRTNDPTAVAIILAIFGSIVIFSTVFMLIRLFSHLIVPRHDQIHGQRHERQTSPIKSGKAVTSGPLPVPLPAPPSAIPSVTEHTTRNFDRRAYDEARVRE
jgi:hypothetical protein